jgi:UDP-glucose-4-epimerase GalE
MGSIMVAGGAGYIGSHCLSLLRERGYDAFAFDDLSEGHAASVQGADLVVGSLSDRDLVRHTLLERKVDAVFHFAALCYVGVSVTDPSSYYRNNVAVTLGLLDTMREVGVRDFIFSSTCATFGNPVRPVIDETHPQWPINPYGWSKFMVERVLADYAHAYDLRYVALRYFNAAGAHPSGQIGEHHDPETHIIPLTLQVALGQRKDVKVFGHDYDTPDGTCIRDYIHILDLSQAHILGLDYLRGGGESTAFNLGNGSGYSVLEVIQACERIVGRPIAHEIVGRRAGDPARLIGDSTRAREVLGWKQQFGDLDTIIRTAWNWHSTHPNGYKD